MKHSGRPIKYIKDKLLIPNIAFHKLDTFQLGNIPSAA